MSRAQAVFARAENAVAGSALGTGGAATACMKTLFARARQ